MRMFRRPIQAIDVRRFGRGRAYALAAEAAPATRLANELRLFALTFAGGFLFMTIYLA